MYLLLKTVISHCHVSFPGRYILNILTESTSMSSFNLLSHHKGRLTMWYVIDIAAGPNMWWPIVTNTRGPLSKYDFLWHMTSPWWPVAMYHVDMQHPAMNATMICRWWTAYKKGPCSLTNWMSNPYQVYELGQPSIRFGLQICMQCCESIRPSACLIACIYRSEIFDATCSHTLCQSDCSLSFLHKKTEYLDRKLLLFLTPSSNGFFIGIDIGGHYARSGKHCHTINCWLDDGILMRVSNRKSHYFISIRFIAKSYR